MISQYQLGCLDRNTITVGFSVLVHRGLCLIHISIASLFKLSRPASSAAVALYCILSPLDFHYKIMPEHLCDAWRCLKEIKAAFVD